MVTDRQIAWLRAWVSGDDVPELSEADKDWRVLVQLVAAVFYRVAIKRLGDADLGQVIDYVADLRTRSAWMAEKVDPGVAERLLLAATPAEEDFQDIEPPARLAAWMAMVGDMVADYKLTSEQLDRFVARLRAEVDEKLAGESTQPPQPAGSGEA
jgi:hypothetical protein